MKISKKEEKALFRFNIIFPLLDQSLPRGERARKVREICAKEYVIPHSRKTTLSAGTVWKWYETYVRYGTIDSLAPKGRSDCGGARVVDAQALSAFVGLWRENQGVPVTALVAIAVEKGIFNEGRVPSMSTLYALIRKERDGFQPTQKDRRAYRAPGINDMWQSDALHGPHVRLEDGRIRKAILFLIQDNRSRLVCAGGWYSAESAESFMDCLWRAFQTRGLPKKLYVDNGSSYRDERIRYGCASLGINLSYARPYTPQGKGCIERLNRTVRDSFLSTLPRGMMTLEELNTRFDSWIDEYNRRPHSSLDGMSPLQCYLGQLKAVNPAPENVPLHFRRVDTRLVANDRTVRFMGSRLEAPIGYAGRRIEIRYFDHDPVHTCEAFFEGRSIGLLHPVDLEANYSAHRRKV